VTTPLRRDSDPPPPRGLSGLGRRFLDWQSQFSVVSAVLSGVLALTMITDYFVGHEHFDRAAVAAWAFSYLVLTFVPLVCGARYPRWLGIVLVAYLTFWSSYSLIHSSHAHMELNALLESPMVAVYLGWFFSPWVARAALATHLVVVSLAVLLRPDGDAYLFSSNLALLYTLLIAGICLEAASRMRARADREAWHDPLTGALNRRGLVHRGWKAIARALQTGQPLCLAVVDFDDFKAVNDGGGHAAGDEALRAVSAGWLEDLGRSGLVARTGGDEFVLVFFEDERAAQERLERMRSRAAHPWSWGLVRFHEDDSFEDLIVRADIELYKRKQSKQSKGS